MGKSRAVWRHVRTPLSSCPEATYVQAGCWKASFKVLNIDALTTSEIGLTLLYIQ